MARYGLHADRAEEIVCRTLDILTKNTPDGWRFTESASSRFFIVDEETHAKFMGLSYRDAGLDIVRDIQADIIRQRDIRDVFRHLEEYVDAYCEVVKNHELPIVHQIRTVYGKRDAQIQEEKRIFDQTAATLDHLIPLASKKIASRPNAAIGVDGRLWVRQHMNWLSLEQGLREYYLFQPLSREGIDRKTFAVFSHTGDGKFQKEKENEIDCSIGCRGLEHVKPEAFRDPRLRSDSYWKVPTFLDRRYIDLKFLKEQTEKTRPSAAGAKGIKKKASGRHLAESERFRPTDLTEFYLLEKIIAKAGEKLGAPQRRPAP